MGPLMNEAMLAAAALVSSAVLETLNLLNSSSSTCTDLAFSAAIVFPLLFAASAISTAGAICSDVVMLSKRGLAGEMVIARVANNDKNLWGIEDDDDEGEDASPQGTAINDDREAALSWLLI